MEPTATPPQRWGSTRRGGAGPPTGGARVTPDLLLADGLERGLFTGAALVAADRDGHRLAIVAGDHGDPPATPVSATSRFDLASLTKGLATALVCARLVADRALTWESPACCLLPTLKRGRHREITVEQLLAHTSGLPAWAPLYQQRVHHALLAASGDPPPPAWRPAMVAHAAASDLLARPGERFCYSDLGYLLLGAVVEVAAGAPLSCGLTAWVTEPLGLGESLAFRPACPRAGSWQGCVATEACGWRGRRLHGEVHDENGWAMGGVAGHAGLFGTATAVATVVDRLLAAARGDDAWLPTPVARALLALPPQGPAERWCRGFDRPSAVASQAGERLSRTTGRGLLGFTGTSVWFDLAQAACVVVLTNRVHAGRAERGFRDLRPAIYDACWRFLSGEGG